MAEVPYVRPPIAGKRQAGGRDAAIARLARHQHGVVARRQLIWLGYTRHQIDRRIASGILHVVHRGVYAVGHDRLTREGRWFAAVLAAGDNAVLSHESAAAIWRLRDKERDIEVTAPTQRRQRRGIRMHEASLASTDVTTRHGIPVTITSAGSLSKCLSSRQGQTGVTALRKALAKADLGKGPTREGLEQQFRRFLRRYDLPRPTSFNAPMEVNGRHVEADCLWAKQRLVVELDGRAAHMTTDAFHADRARDQDLVAARYRVIRITWWQLTHEADRIAGVLRSLLGESG